jgi:hypothetical protein
MHVFLVYRRYKYAKADETESDIPFNPPSSISFISAASLPRGRLAREYVTYPCHYVPIALELWDNGVEPHTLSIAPVHTQPASLGNTPSELGSLIT